MAYCSYYQASVPPKTCWLFVATLRSCDHLCFDRTIDVPESRFEFFVPISREATFLHVMHWMQKQGLVENLIKLPNRLIDQKTV